MECLLGLEMAVSVEATVWQKLGGKEGKAGNLPFLMTACSLAQNEWYQQIRMN